MKELVDILDHLFYEVQHLRADVKELKENIPQMMWEIRADLAAIRVTLLGDKSNQKPDVDGMPSLHHLDQRLERLNSIIDKHRR